MDIIVHRAERPEYLTHRRNGGVMPLRGKAE